jgi:TusA-related sulfurtransferase
MSEKDKNYEIEGIISPDEVPNWAKKQPKWGELTDKVRDLKPGETLSVAFEDYKTANRARHQIRDILSLKYGQAVVRTRVVKDFKDGKVRAYFTKIHATPRK